MGLEGVLIKSWNSDLIFSSIVMLQFGFRLQSMRSTVTDGWCRQLNARTSACMAPRSDRHKSRVRICVAPKNSLSHLHVFTCDVARVFIWHFSHPSAHLSLHLGLHLGAPPQSQERRAHILAGRSHEMRTMVQWP